MNIKAIGITLALCTMTCAAYPATRTEIMFSRYMKGMFCMQRALGQDEYNNKLGLDFVMNKWGVSEPTGKSMANASEKVKKADEKCRATNSLGDEPRP